MIEIKGVKKSFGENHILKGVDLDIKDGEVIVILGPAAAAKRRFCDASVFLKKQMKANGLKMVPKLICTVQIKNRFSS